MINYSVFICFLYKYFGQTLLASLLACSKLSFRYYLNICPTFKESIMHSSYVYILASQRIGALQVQQFYVALMNLAQVAKQEAH